MKDVRQEYVAETLDESALHPDPLEQIRRWVDEAVNAELPLANAMTLATATADGQPSCRIVLLKGVESGGLTFFTHHDSRKGLEIAENPRVSAVLFWEPFSRQITLTGHAEPVPREEASRYFASRPRGSQLSAAVSPQSRPVSRERLERDVADLEARLGNDPVPMPAQWGGYRIFPREVQFWHGRPSRLHDRFRYLLGEDGRWTRERLAP